MRTLLVLVALALIVVAGCLYLGIINIDQTRPAIVQAPAFHADVARVTMGTHNETVAVPTISVQKPGDRPTPAN